MKWKQLEIVTTVEAEDVLSMVLAELGFEGVEICDQVPLSDEDKARMFIDILPETDASDLTATVRCYLVNGEDPDEKAAEIREAILPYADAIEFGKMEIRITETDEEDWINNWKQYFKAFRVDESIVIKPTWVEAEETKAGDLVVEIDPGTAFGTGAHETTKLCILGMKKYLREGNRLLDVGCGSGILSIIGKKLGAASCVGTDIDANAVTVAKENAEINGLTLSETKENGALTFLTGDVITDAAFRENVGKETYDVVVANILADIIIPLSDVIHETMRPGAVFLSSGILQEKADAVEAALRKNGFRILEKQIMGDWVSFACAKGEKYV